MITAEKLLALGRRSYVRYLSGYRFFFSFFVLWVRDGLMKHSKNKGMLLAVSVYFFEV